MSNFGKAFGSMIMFFIILLSYTPLKEELVTVAGNATLTHTGVVILNTIFGLIWILLAIFFLGLSAMFAMRS